MSGPQISHTNSGDNTLSPSHTRELAESGIPESYAQQAGVYSTSDQSHLARLLNRKSCDFGRSLVYPFFASDGMPTGYVRVKPGKPPTDTKGKVQKYLAPSKTSPRLYIAPGARAILGDPSKPLLLTEGTKQALSADHHGFPAVACMGVWGGFLKRPKGPDGKPTGPRVLIPDFDQIAWQDRIVLLCFDSDSSTKPLVVAALKAMTKALAARGACVKVIRLPDAEDGSKQGVDDFLARHGATDLARLIDRVGAVPPQEGKPDDGEGKKKSPPAADMLANIAAAECELWHDATNTAFATVGRLSLPVRSKAFKQWLTGRYLEQTAGKVPNSEAISNAVNAIESQAIFEGTKAEAHVRCAGHDGKIYLNLADESSTVIEITPGGWRVCDSPPVRFRHSPSALPLPMPVHDGGSLDLLRELLNIPDDDTWSLLTGWLMACFMPDGPYPVLCLTGEQGSSKTTLAKVLKALADPSTAPTRSPPKEIRDLMIATRAARVLIYDNLSNVPVWLSDGLCVMSTGGGLSTRELYTDSDEIIFSAKRPTILASIGDVANRGDLLDRAIVLKLPAIPSDKRKLESKFWKQFEAIRAEVLGAVLDRVAAGLRALPSVRLADLPRMADFCLWAVACEQGSGEPERFFAAYAKNQVGSQALPLEDASITEPLLRHLESHPGGWTGAPTELLTAIAEKATDAERKSESWPKNASSLGKKLASLAPSFRKVHGIDITQKRGDDRKRSRFVSITPAPDKARDLPSDVSNVSETPENKADSINLSPVRNVSGSRPQLTTNGQHTDCGHDADACGQDADTRATYEKPSKSSEMDTSDASDTKSRDISGSRPKRRFGNNPHKGTVLDPERNGP